MNTSALETFARDTRKALMDAVERKLDYVLRADTADLRAAAAQVASLRESARRDRPALVERAAYTWFNRLTALRFLDAKDWHPFGVRVLTAASAGESQPGLLKAFRASELPEELTHFTPVKRLNDLLDGRLPTAIAGADPQGEVYRHLILAACRYYHDRMPFLFEALDDETELLLPDDLLTAHSIAEGFRTEISDDDCGAVEVLGWLYQYYISGKKSIVMARKAAVPSADIPAVTQLFTPHWIVRYLVENSLGRLWLLNRPGSKLREQMPYYIEDAPAPSPQPPAPFPHLDRPEDIRLLDPACGSGHMLTYAFDLLYAIYEEEGYPAADIPGLILSHNLHGLEICPRATQLAQFALVCKARERNRNAFRQPIAPQVMCLQNVVIGDGELAAWAKAIKLQGLLAGPALEQLHQFRENTETFGALIQPVMEAAAIVGMKKRIGDEAPPGDLFLQDTHRKVRLVLDQAEMLSQRYHVVVANPPYMGNKGMNFEVKRYLDLFFGDYKSDLFSAFMVRSMSMSLLDGLLGFMSPFVWMFISSYEKLRVHVLEKAAVTSLVQLEYSGFEGATVPICTFTFQNHPKPPRKSYFIRLTNFRGASNQGPRTLEAIRNRQCGWFYEANTEDFRKIPGSPFAYWARSGLIKAFENASQSVGGFVETEGKNVTTNNDRFVRCWWEVSFDQVGISPKRWFPFATGGGYRKWFGNLVDVVDWSPMAQDHYRHSPAGRLIRKEFWYLRGITWSKITSSKASFRILPREQTYQEVAILFAPEKESLLLPLLGYLNCTVSEQLLQLLAPTLNFQLEDICRLPWYEIPDLHKANEIVQDLLTRSKIDWDCFETSWEYRDQPLLGSRRNVANIESGWQNWETYCAAAIRQMQELESENNRIFIHAYGLENELHPEVSEDQITLSRPDRRKDMAAFLSYAVGCMMGRYSLDKPGLLLADAGDTLEHYLAKVGKTRDQWTFAPDEDGIVPVLDGEWFGDDVVARFREFLRVTFGEASLDENLRFIEESLGKDLRAYFVTQFYKDHLQTYKKRPIYWLFQSPGKSFQCLVYLHRYTRDTVNRILNRYLREYLAKLRAAINLREHTLASETASARDKTRARKEAEQYRKSLRECEDWERGVLLPLAQQRVELDLDDGVKVNYLKLGEALAPIPGLAAPEEA